MEFTKPPSGLLYLLSFIEGASVMAAELIGAKMLSPYFGSSLYVWATVMAVTLGGLAMGYFAGGLLSAKTNNPKVVYRVILLAALFVMLMPLTSELVLHLAGSHALIPSVIASTVLFLLPPVWLMGMVSPLLIHQLALEEGKAGKAAGAVYAISTVGGICATFLTGFWIIPSFGLRIPCVFTGILLGILPLALLMRKNVPSVLAALGALGLISGSLWNTTRAELPSEIHIPYQSEGLLGQLMVVDYPNYSKDGSIGPGRNRILFVNRIGQTQGNDRVDSLRQFSYIDQIVKNVQVMPVHSSALVCGLGGGSLVLALNQAGWEVEGCELDPRIEYVARNFFNLPPAVRVTIDDARHYIRMASRKYDLVVLDLFKGEENPGHCFTTEAFTEIQRLLNPGGALVINGHGFISAEAGRGMRAVCRTLMASGFRTCLLPTGPREEFRNLIFYATRNTEASPGYIEGWIAASGGSALLPEAVLGPEDKVMTDDKPVLDQLNALAYRTWRKNAIAFFENESQRGRRIPAYH